MMPFLVIHTDWDQHPLSDDDQKSLAQTGIEVRRLESSSREEFLDIAGKACGVLNADFPITADLISALKVCRIISRYGTGLDNIDVKAATRLRIPVANVPDFCTDAVADRTLLLLLACAGNLVKLDRYVRARRWGLKEIPYAWDLWGKRLGLIGFGKIGQAVAARAKGFGLAIGAYDPYLNREVFEAHGVEQVNLEVLLQTSDIVSLHLPLSDESKHLLDRTRIRLMKRPSILINAARGGIVDSAALAEAIQERHLFAAGLDVLEKEPPPCDCPLLSLENVVITPHCAAHTAKATERVRREALEAVKTVFRNERPKNLVNPEVWPIDGKPL